MTTPLRFSCAVAGLIALAMLPGTAAAQAPTWTVETATQLLRAVEDAGADGLDPRDYAPGPLKAAIAAGDAEALQSAAGTSYRRLAHDLVQGHVGAEQRRAWHIPAPAAEPGAIDTHMARALADGRIRAFLETLLPRDPQYRALKAALAATPPADRARIETLRVNLERWRWLPRDLGARHLLVNVPGYTLTVVENGRLSAVHRVIVGKPRTPTPQFAATVSGAIVNPWWEIPQSIVAESVGALVRTRPAVATARGYRWSTDEGGHLRVRQAPGDGNSLGRVKLVMPNPFSIFIHDTPAKALFARPVRAFSHGCIRTENPLDLAARLAGRKRAELDAIVASGETTQIDVPRLPVYVVYLTATADPDGKVSVLPDLYGRDDPVAAELADREAADQAD
jgi:murein L,D-transpeptidase YcbB/YkuD